LRRYAPIETKNISNNNNPKNTAFQSVKSNTNENVNMSNSDESIKLMVVSVRKHQSNAII
jgi:hypothetical protein